MSERETKVETYQVRLFCDGCADSEMEFTGAVLMSNPPQYPHRCPNCGKVTHERTKYPLTRHKEIGEVEPL